MDSCDVYIVMDSEVKLSMITEGVFLCVGGMELNDLLHCGTEGRYVNGPMDRGWRSLELDRDGWISSCE